MRTTAVRAFLFLAFAFSHFSSPAQNGDYIISSKHYTYKDGLSTNHIRQPFVDSRGIIWLVRHGGLDRFDGLHFKSLDFPALKKVEIFKIYLEDADHNLWLKIHENSTFLLFNIFTEQLCTVPEKYGSKYPDNIKWVYRAHNNGILVRTESDSIIRYPASGAPEFVYASKYPTSPFADNSDGSTWMYSWDERDKGEIFLYGADQQKKMSVPIQNIGSFCGAFSNHDTVCFKTADSLFMFNRQGLVLQKALKNIVPSSYYKNPDGSSQSPTIKYDKSKGFFWLYYPKGMVILDKHFNCIYHFKQLKQSFASNYLYDFMVDDQGYVWLGNLQGLFQLTLKHNPFRQYLSAPSDRKEMLENFKSCRSIVQAPDGQVYAIAASVIYRLLPNGNVEEVTRKPQMDRWDLIGLDADKAGDLWYISSRLHKFNIRTGKQSDFDFNTYSSWAFNIIDNQLWIGKPLACLDIASGNLQIIEALNGFAEFKEARVYDITVKSAQELWLVTTNGIYMLDKEKGIMAHYWSKGTGQYYLPEDNLRHYYEDTDGSWWLACSEGLLHWNRKTGAAHLYGKEVGVSKSCHAVLADDYGFLWISSDYGLMQFDKSTGSARSFFTEDGLASDEFNRKSYLKDNRGILYFGGINGIVSFDPKAFNQKLESSLPSLHLVLTECLIFSGKSNLEEDIRIKVLNSNHIDIFPGDRFLKVKVALTDYSDPARITYQYRIKGYEDIWHSSHENELLISGLPYGNFVLEVTAQTPVGLASNQFLQISIKVHRPFYQQGWFLILAVLLLLGAIVWYVRRRTQILKTRANLLEETVQERTQVIESQQQKLKSLYDLKSRLYANITHEFRTPLTMIIGPASRALPKAQKLEQPEIVDTLKKIMVHGQQMLGLVNQMLDLNKLEAKAMTPTYTRTDVVGFVAQIVSHFQSNAQHKQVALTFVAASESLILDLDHDNTEKILNNLISNALKFTPGGGNVQVSLSVQQEWLEVVVADNGCGIEPEHLPNIFERYYQVENQSTRKYSGTGIGLALVKELTELLEGTIQASSTLGAGSQFTLRLPVREEISGETIPPTPAPIPDVALLEASATQAASAKNSKSSRILIIEDTPAVAQFAASCLQDRYAVSTALSSKIGLKQAQKTIPDLILCDIMMPEMDGYAVCKAIKTDQKTSHIPVVFLTALEENTDRLRRIEAGADAFLSKPFKQEELLGLVQTMLVQQKRLQEKYLRARADAEPDSGLENEPGLNPKDLQLLLRLQVLIHENLDNPQLDVQVLCKKIGLSQSQLHRKLIALTGMSIGRYISHIRLQEALKLLDQPDCTIAEIAFQTGFSDPAYFTRLFAKTYGHSPRAYRSEL